MRRAVLSTGLALLLILGTGQGEARQAGAATRLAHLRTAGVVSANPLYEFRSTDNEGDWRAERCRYRNLEGGPGWSVHEVELTIRCAVRRWPVDGGAEKALAVARCESGLNELAYNAGGCGGYGCGGVFQQHLRYWDGRFDALAPPWWRLPPGPLNGRSNVVVSIRMAHARGWYADWACA